MLTDLNITMATDITRAVPSLKMNAYSSSQVVFNIRGVSQNDYGDQQEPPVAVYQDDSYASSINVASFPIFDLARVEVLRGPQGTLFGRNATGGAIQFVSNKPTKDFEGYATATVGSYNQFIVEGALSGPLADNFQARIAAISNTDDGYMESVVAGVPDRGGNDHYAVRGQLAWQPSETTDLNLLVRYMKANKETQAGIYSQEPACPNDQFQGEFTKADQSCAFWGTGPGEGGTGYRNDAITPSRGGDPWKTAETQRSYVDREITGATLHFDWDIGELHLVSITDYQDATKFYLEGGDASPVDGVLFYQGSDLEQYSQEFRLSGAMGDHTWVAGLYGMKVDGEYTGKFATPFYGYDPTIEMSQKTTSYAVFAQDEWQFADAWKLIVGARYWSDEREGNVLRHRAGSAGTVGPGHDHLQPERGVADGRHRSRRRTPRTASTASRRACSSTGSRPTTCCCTRASTAAARAVVTRSRRARRTIRTAVSPSRARSSKACPSTRRRWMRSNSAPRPPSAIRRRSTSPRSTTTIPITRPLRSSARCRPSSISMPRRRASKPNSRRGRSRG